MFLRAQQYFLSSLMLHSGFLSDKIHVYFFCIENVLEHEIDFLFISSPARSAQSYCCHLGRPRLRLRPRHTFG